jgi:uncharacterized protein (DUF1697 family)
MPDRYVALLRGVNVGRANRVAMADLRQVVGALGFAEPRTLLNSGNVVFQATGIDPVATAVRIESALAGELGVSARVIVIGAEAFETAVAGNPFALVDDPARMLVAFLAPGADTSKVRALLDRDWSSERLAIVGDVAYLWCSNGVAASPLSAAVSRAAGDRLTARNWATVLKLSAMLRAPTPDVPQAR